ncbi:MAG: F0F1 ATP synthase subunit B [Acidobacteriota bacterium]
MLIDWFTVGAQALNFLILVWLMKRYLYTPILNAIDAREKLLAAELADAAKKKDEAKMDRDEFQAKNDKFDEQRAALLKKANDDAKTELDRLLAEANKTAAALSNKRHDALLKDAHSLNKAIRHRTEQEVFAIARKALTELASADLEECMANVLISRIDGIDDKTKKGLAAALKGSSDPAIVRSAFELPDKQRAAIQDSFDVTFADKTPIQFETSPDLISGIELVANGQKVAWSISDYLTSLEDGVNEILKKDDATNSTATEKNEAKSNTETKTDVPMAPKSKSKAPRKSRSKPDGKAAHASKKDDAEKAS